MTREESLNALDYLQARIKRTMAIIDARLELRERTKKTTRELYANPACRAAFEENYLLMQRTAESLQQAGAKQMTVEQQMYWMWVQAIAWNENRAEDHQ